MGVTNGSNSLALVLNSLFGATVVLTEETFCLQDNDKFLYQNF